MACRTQRGLAKQGRRVTEGCSSASEAVRETRISVGLAVSFGVVGIMSRNSSEAGRLPRPGWTAPSRL